MKVITIVIGALDTIMKVLIKGLEEMEIRGQVETIQMIALFKPARIPRVLKICEFGLVLWRINNFRLSNAKFIFIKYSSFSNNSL